MKRDELHSDATVMTRAICDSIKALPQWARTGESLGHICHVLVTAVKESGWGHVDLAENAMQSLADAASYLDDMESSSVGIDDSVAWMRERGVL